MGVGPGRNYRLAFINANASSFQTWGTSTGNWHPLSSGYIPQPGDVAEYSGAHVAIYVSGPAGSPTVVNGDWQYPDTGNYQVYQQTKESTAGGGALSGYVSPPAGSNGGIASAPAVVQRSNGETDVLAVGTNGALYYYYNALGSPNWNQLTVAPSGLK